MPPAAPNQVRAGARFFQLQVCFHKDQLERFMAEAVASGLAEKAALLPSICLVRTPSVNKAVEHPNGCGGPEGTMAYLGAFAHQPHRRGPMQGERANL